MEGSVSDSWAEVLLLMCSLVDPLLFPTNRFMRRSATLSLSSPL